MDRVLVVAMSGAGKTTAARRLSERAGMPFFEMDALSIGPGWSSPVSLEADLAEILDRPRWVIDSWGPVEQRDALWAAADTVVWLDYPRRVVWPRLLRRSLRRSWTREPIFGGNVETWALWLSRDHPVWHALTTFGQRRAYLAERTRADPRLATVRLRRPRELDVWLAGVESG